MPDTRPALIPDAELYERDFYAWTQTRAATLREAAAAGRLIPLDWENLAEEIESLGRSDLHACRSYLAQIMAHLAKLEWSPAAEPRRKWRHEVSTFRRAILRLVDDSPSLRRKLGDYVGREWRNTIKAAGDDFAVYDEPAPDLPPDCPYSFDQLLDTDFLPANRHGLT